MRGDSLPRWVVLAMTLAAPPGANAEMTLREVLVLQTPELKPGADPAAFEAYVLADVIPAWTARAPEWALHLVRADRGNRKGQYALVWTFGESRAERSPGQPAAPMLSARLKEFEAGLSRFVTGWQPALEYRLVSPAGVGAPPRVDVLGLHFVRAKPDRVDAFERFVRERLHPAVGTLRPDLRLLYYRASAAEPGRYLALFALTRASRDKYWPGGSDSDDLRAAFEPVLNLARDLAPYLVDDSYLADRKFAAAVYESRDWADFVLVSAPAR